jgi:hypothetical protein
MNLIDRLEKRARELDRDVIRHGDYYTKPADDRELLLEAAKRLRELERQVELFMKHDGNMLDHLERMEKYRNDQRRDDRSDDCGGRRVDGPDWPVEGTVTGAD